MFGSRHHDCVMTNESILKEVSVKIQKYLLLLSTKDLGFWLEFEVDCSTMEDLKFVSNACIDEDWVKGIN